MNLKLILVVLLIELCADLIKTDDYDKEFNEWFNTYRASSATKRDYDITDRKRIWTDRYISILQHNKRYEEGKETYKQAPNEFTDLTRAEFRARYLGHVATPNKGRVIRYRSSGKTLPASVDWVKAGYVNIAKNQGNCGSCYVFAAINSLEGQVKRYFNQLPILSTQQVTSCGGRGCDGGNAGIVYTYLNSSGGIVAESSYKYTSGATNNIAGTCQTPKPIDSRLIVAKVLDTVTVVDPSTTESEALLADALATVGPISVGIFASGEGFQSYSSGVYSCKSCSTEADHDVTAVGFGTDSASGKSYFALMNSWGPSWGINGQIWVERNNNFMIGIGKQGYYPILDQSYAPPPVIKPPAPQDLKTNSSILKGKEDDMLISANGAGRLSLLYRGTRDGFSSTSFHKKCDGNSNTIVLIRPRSSNYVFGGYAAKPWDSTNRWIRDPEAYVFSIRKNGVSELETFPIRSGYENYALRGGSSTTLRFGSNLVILNNANRSNSNQIGLNCVVYECPDEALDNDADVILTGKNGPFQVAEIEVFKLIYSKN